MASREIGAWRIGIGLGLLMLGAMEPATAASTAEASQGNSVLTWIDKRHPIIKLALQAMVARGYDTSPYAQVVFGKTREHYSLIFYPSLRRRAKPVPLLHVVVEIRSGKVISVDETPALR